MLPVRRGIVILVVCILYLVLSSSAVTGAPPTNAEQLAKYLNQTAQRLKEKLILNPMDKEALADLIVMAEGEPSSITAFVSMILGDYYFGRLHSAKDSRVRLPPPIDLPKAFKYYHAATLAPHEHQGLAHYFVSFILHYHPRAVPVDYLGFPPSIESTPGQTIDSSSEMQMPFVLLHQAAGAKLDNLECKTSLAIKHELGRHTPKSCRVASEYLREVTEGLVEPYRDVIKPLVKMSSESVRLDKEYKTGRSVKDEERDLIEYYRYSADRKQSVESLIGIGAISLEGLGGIAKNYEDAYRYFKIAAGVKIDKNGNVELDANPDSEAMTHLAYMHMHGYGVPANNDTALVLLYRASELGNLKAHTQLGICYLHGLCSVKQNIAEAYKYFTEAAQKEDPEANYQLGMMWKKKLTHQLTQHSARAHFQKATSAGHLPATWELAVLHQEGYGIPVACDHAAQLFGKVLARTYLRELAQDAYAEYTAGNFAKAILMYEMAGDMNHLLGHVNAAWMYEMADIIPLDFGYKLSTRDRQEKSLRWYHHGADLDSSSSNLKLGDYYYYGIGTQPNIKQAATYYQTASTLKNPQGCFNVGLMHQFGDGLQLDHHLAKRYYDLAIQYDRGEALVPATLALTLLEVQANLKSIGVDGTNLFTAIATLPKVEWAWDTLTIAALSIILVFALIARKFTH